MLFREWDVVEQPIVLSGLTKRLVAEGNEFLEVRSKEYVDNKITRIGLF